ncbi:MAG: hypothetical protein EOO14_21560 [Chitinophagaceae bacterium]|nr:MAG: hypothetical protein EOO14_21560 [Chitinophagaceae bacterium]
MFGLSSIILRSKHIRRFCFFFLLSLGAILLVNLFIGLLLHSNPLLPFADSENQLSMMLTGTLLGSALFLLNRCLSFIESLLRKKENTAFLLSLFCFPLLLLSSCEIETSSRVQVKSSVQGTISNAATGLKAVYRNMETEKIKLVMNDEVLGHADIPLGEKFYIINEGIKGLVEKEGTVSIGCSLQITDEQGNVILDEPDLFSGNDLFKKEEATFLRCAVSTGRPMETEYYYTVRAKFWDKYGDGFIDNTVRIRSIDMP